MTVLHAGGKFDHSSYKVSAGLHGVGVSAVNAVSEWLKMEIKREGHVYFQEYRRGVPDRSARGHRRHRQDRHEDHLQARPRDLHDAPSSATTSSPAACASSRSSTPASSSRSPTSAASGRKETFEYKGGIREFVEHLNKAKEPVHDKVVHIVAESAGRRAAHADRRRGRAPVELELRRADLPVHEQRPQQGRRHAPHRLPRRAHARVQQLRHGAEPLQRGEERPHRRRHPRRAHRRHQREASPTRRFDSQTK